MPKAVAVQKPEPSVVVNVREQTAPPSTPKADPDAEPNWFFDKLEKLEPVRPWNQHTLELMRLDPKMPGVSGSKGFLDVFTEPITRAQVRAKYGGGKFRLLLLKNSQYVTSHDFEIEGDPIYARGREMPAAGANGNLEGRLLNMLEQNLKEMKEELRSREADGRPDPAFAKSIDMMTTTYTTLLDTAAKANSTGKQEKPTELLKDLISTAKDLGLPVGAQPNNILETITALKNLGLIGAQPNNPLEQLKMFLDIFEKMDALRGERPAAGGRRTSGWETIAEKAADTLLPSLADRLKNNSESRVRRVGAVRPTVAPNPAPVPQQSTLRPAPVQRPASSAAPPPAAGLRIVAEESAAPAEAAPEFAAPPIEVVPLSARDAEEAAYIAGVKRRVVECVKSAEPGEGAIVVDFLEVAWPQAVNWLEVFPAEKITEFFGNDPILREAVQHPNWPAVLEDALAYLHEDLPEAAAAAAGPN